MTTEQIKKAQQLFGTPDEFYDTALRLVDEREWELILRMGDTNMSEEALCALIARSGLSSDPADFLRECCRRSLLIWDPDKQDAPWRIGTFSQFYSNYFLSLG